jgi:small GTP-binding protein
MHPTTGDINIFEMVERTLEDELKKLGIVNILVAGRSGVGKSTLINAVFGKDFAETGQGRPITKETRKITKHGVPVALFDTRGLEMDRYKETLDQLKSFIASNRENRDADDHVHVAWICVSEDSRRVEEGESAVAALLTEMNIPFIVVITKSRADQGFKKIVSDLIPTASQVLSIRALPEHLDDGHTLPAKGVVELIAATHEIVPEGKQSAFAAAQQVDINLKKTKARKIMATAATAAAAIAVSPIPFSDAALLIPAQISMICGITAALGISLETGALTSVATSVVGCSAATIGGQLIVGNLLKLIPGGGSIAGAAVSAGTASALTVALGELYLSILVELIQRFGRAPTGDEISSAFKAAWKERGLTLK